METRSCRRWSRIVRPDEHTVDNQSDIRNIIALNDRDPEVLLGSHRFTDPSQQR